jgi:N-acetylmuramoyl-L-alanine amidase
MNLNYLSRVLLIIIIIGGSMPRGKRTINNIFIHHSATPRDTTEHDAVKKYHMEERGWSDIGYHYTIDYAGVVRKGRPDNRTGAHVKGHNTASLGICLFGNFENENPTKPQIDALTALLRTLQELYKIPAGEIKAHKDVSPTACCGKNLYGLLPWVRTQLKQNPK